MSLLQLYGDALWLGFWMTPLCQFWFVVSSVHHYRRLAYMTILLATRCFRCFRVACQAAISVKPGKSIARCPVGCWHVSAHMYTQPFALQHTRPRWAFSSCSAWPLSPSLSPPVSNTARYATTVCQAIMSPRLQRWCNVVCEMTSALAPSSNRFRLVARRRRVRLACLNASSKWFQPVIDVSSELCTLEHLNSRCTRSTC